MPTTSGFVIRPFVEDDYSAITQYSLPEEQAIYTSLPIEVIKTWQKDNDNQPFVIYSNHHLVGCFALHVSAARNIYTNNEHALLLKSFSIDTRYQQKGYAYETLRSLPHITKLNFPEKNEILLTVHHTNTPAITLYKKAGFLDKGLRYEGEHGEELLFHFELNCE